MRRRLPCGACRRWTTCLANRPLPNLLDEYPRGEVTAAVRDVLDQRRTSLRAGQTLPTDTGSLALAIREALYKRSLPHLRRVINATGIVLHTGLGRAPLAAEAVEAIADISAAYCNLELESRHGSAWRSA